MKILEDGFCGSTIKHISKDYVSNIEIPIPSIDQQKEIIKQIDDLNDENKKLKEQIKQNINKSKQFISGMVIKSINDTKPIDEVQNEIVNVDEEVIIEPIQKIKKIVKKIKNPIIIIDDAILIEPHIKKIVKKVKHPIVIVNEENN